VEGWLCWVDGRELRSGRRVPAELQGRASELCRERAAPPRRGGRGEGERDASLLSQPSSWPVVTSSGSAILSQTSAALQLGRRARRRRLTFERSSARPRPPRTQPLLSLRARAQSPRQLCEWARRRSPTAASSLEVARPPPARRGSPAARLLVRTQASALQQHLQQSPSLRPSAAPAARSRARSELSATTTTTTTTTSGRQHETTTFRRRSSRRTAMCSVKATAGPQTRSGSSPTSSELSPPPPDLHRLAPRLTSFLAARSIDAA